MAEKIEKQLYEDIAVAPSLSSTEAELPPRLPSLSMGKYSPSGPIMSTYQAPSGDMPMNAFSQGLDNEWSNNMHMSTFNPLEPEVIIKEGDNWDRTSGQAGFKRSKTTIRFQETEEAEQFIQPRDSVAPIQFNSGLSMGPLVNMQQHNYNHTLAPVAREQILQLSNSIFRRPPVMEPQIGFTAYVGSPVNGNIVIGNPTIVDNWLRYIRASQVDKVIGREGPITTGELSQICDVFTLPDNLHHFSFLYDPPPSFLYTGKKPSKHKIKSKIWQSISYPCHIISCTCTK